MWKLVSDSSHLFWAFMQRATALALQPPEAPAAAAPAGSALVGPASQPPLRPAEVDGATPPAVNAALRVHVSFPTVP